MSSFLPEHDPEVFDLLGQRVAILVDSHLEAGMHSVVWNASQMSSGMYFYKLSTGDITEIRKMILLK